MDAETGLCRGCRRTIGEIASWGALSDEDRLRVLAALAERHQP